MGQTETISHHGRTTAYRGTGRDRPGETVLYVHGSSATRDLWRAQHRLERDRPVVSLDLSGHGDSSDVDADPGYTALSAYADDVIAVAEATDARTLVGSSLGGAVVLHTLLERAFTPEAVVLAGTGARMGVLEDLLEWLRTDFERAVEFLHRPDCLFHDADDDLRERSMQAMYETGQAVTSRDFLTCHRFDVRDQLGAVDVPTLAVCGEHDQLTPPWYHEYLAEEIPDADWVTLEGCAHLTMLERPEAFTEAVSGFLADRGL
ncbi:alpha/beta fold hydrolase [Natronobiforma cellulositropha]|uniref:alpha/beta fold hydrolase n=1 Tax=Natronobiforma cellulositropha TaxID=1679076 RepID=UPI0021D60A2D|nr:alpha/beta hydrolase [Natronobiforma cellulositropha]